MQNSAVNRQQNDLTFLNLGYFLTRTRGQQNQCALYLQRFFTHVHNNRTLLTNYCRLLQPRTPFSIRYLLDSVLTSKRACSASTGRYYILDGTSFQLTHANP